MNTNVNGSDEMLNVHAVAKMLNISTWQVYQYAAEGKIPSIRFGIRTVRFKKGDIEQWVKGLNPSVEIKELSDKEASIASISAKLDRLIALLESIAAKT